MVTLKDIALRVGVSVPTVSLILAGKGARHSARTRQAVLRAARALHYEPNIAGKGLRQRKSFLLGALLYGVNSSLMSDFLRGLGAALVDNEYSPVVFSHDTPEEEALHVQRCRKRRVDGFIANLAVAPDGLLRASREAGVAVPGELSLVGFGDSDLARLTQPALTTFRLPVWEVGFAAARLLLALTRGEPAAGVRLQPELLMRESVVAVD